MESEVRVQGEKRDSECEEARAEMGATPRCSHRPVFQRTHTQGTHTVCPEGVVRTWVPEWTGHIRGMVEARGTRGSIPAHSSRDCGMAVLLRMISRAM